MNIIKIENVKRIVGSTHGLEIKTEYKYDANNTIMVVLNEEEIINENSAIKLRGYNIHSLLIPKKFKYTFNDTKIYDIIKQQFDKNFVISYY